jgi:hypothetical protein
MSIPNIQCQIRMFGMTATKRPEAVNYFKVRNNFVFLVFSSLTLLIMCKESSIVQLLLLLRRSENIKNTCSVICCLMICFCKSLYSKINYIIMNIGSFLFRTFIHFSIQKPVKSFSSCCSEHPGDFHSRNPVFFYSDLPDFLFRTSGLFQKKTAIRNGILCKNTRTKMDSPCNS